MTGKSDRQALAALAKHPELHVRQMDTTPYAEILEQVRHLSAESMVFYVNIQRDAAGQTRFPSLVAEELSAASSVPVYGIPAHWLERGILGGAITDYVTYGQEIGGLVVARLDGQTPTPRAEASSPMIINWRALKKWQVPESRVPAEAIVRFKPPSLWQEHRGIIIGIFLVVAMQSALIAGLLLNRARRRRAVAALGESEERLSLAAESANLGLWAWDIARDEIWVTPRFRSTFGFGPEERITFAAFRERVHADDREAMERSVRIAINEKEPYDEQYRLALGEGGARWIAAAGRVEYSASGEASRMLGVCRDITERRHAQLEAQRLQHEIAHVGRVSMMGQLASALAHEINQPLGAILRNAEAAELFMKSENPDLEEIRAILADIRIDDQRAGNVIDGMRAMLKRSALDTQLLDLAELAGNVAGLAGPDAAARHVKLSVNLPKDLPPVRGDRIHLQQVLLNLILNGMDALKEASPLNRSVTVSAHVNGAETIEVAVSDTGPGVAPEQLAHVFDPFFTTKVDGMGMGLPISRTIIEAHGGRLWAEDNNDGGATFRFTVPLAEKAAAV